MSERETFTLTIASTGRWNAPPIIRLRKLLKALIRSFGFRVVGLVETQDEPPEGAE